MSPFRVGSLDHIHLVVPDRYAAARWYTEKLGFEIVEEYEEWARVEGPSASGSGGRPGFRQTNPS